MYINHCVMASGKYSENATKKILQTEKKTYQLFERLTNVSWPLNWGPRLNPSLPYSRDDRGVSGRPSMARDVSGSTHRKIFQNLILKQTEINQIIFSIFWFIWNQMDVRVVPNQSENGKYNLISVCFDKISKIFLSV